MSRAPGAVLRRAGGSRDGFSTALKVRAGARAWELARGPLARAESRRGAAAWRRVLRPEPAGRLEGGQDRGASAFQGVGSGRDVSAASNRGAPSRQALAPAAAWRGEAGASGGGGAARGGGRRRR